MPALIANWRWVRKLAVAISMRFKLKVSGTEILVATLNTFAIALTLNASYFFAIGAAKRLILTLNSQPYFLYTSVHGHAR
jgi:hypothetical protein